MRDLNQEISSLGRTVVSKSYLRIKPPSNLQGAKIISTVVDQEYDLVKDKFDLNNELRPPPDTLELANEWFTESLKATMLKYEFLKEYASYRRISSFYGLSKSYLYDIRYKKIAIAHEYLDQMRKGFSERLNDLSNDRYLMAIEAQAYIYSIIETYLYKYEPRLTANTQIDKNLKQDYFSLIRTIKQAYYMGLMFADGWISIQYGKARSAYRIGLALKVEDTEIIENFATSIGFTKNRVDIKIIDHRTGKRYKMAYLYFGVGSLSIKNSMAKDLITHGMTYEVNENTGRRYKVPILPIFCDSEGFIQRNLMLAFLLGFYDGDGTLKDNKYPIIYSSNKEFLEAISRVFNLGKVTETKRDVIDVETSEMKQNILYSLSLNQGLFKEMMSLNLNSINRKSIKADDIILSSPVMTKSRLWLMDILPKDFLIRVLDTHSPSRVAELIGIDHNTLIKFIDHIYKIPRKDKAYYIRLAYERNRRPKDSEFNILHDQITQLLIKIGNINSYK